MKFRRNVIWLAIWVVLAIAFGLLDAYGYDLYTMSSGVSVSRTLTIVFAILAGYPTGRADDQGLGQGPARRSGRGQDAGWPAARCDGIAIITAVLALFGVLGTVGTALGAFSGLILGWSLRAPVSVVTAWIMVSLMRPFRVGDRIQLPSLGLVAWSSPRPWHVAFCS